MNTYTITVKPSDIKGELDFYHVDSRQAKEISARWDEHQNVTIGDKKISWQRIVEITAPPASNRLEAPQYCVKCEKGWLFSRDGAYPCSCNAKGKDDMKEYKEYLEKQSWYIREMPAVTPQMAQEVFNMPL